MHNNLDSFKSSANKVLLIIECILFCGLLILSFVKTVKLKEFPFGGLATVIMWLTFFFIFFHEIFSGLGLFINRQFNRGVTTKVFIVDGVDDSSKTVYLFYPAKDGGLIDSWVGKQVYRSDLHERDTVYLRFATGLFGVEYFDGVDKK